jgi:hypothetical protein
MRYLTNGLTKWHVIVLVGMLGVFMALTFLITNAGIEPGPDHDTRVLQATLGTITGPLTGAMSRGFQPCCLEFSLRVMLYCGPILAVGLLVQFVRLPDGRWLGAVRIGLWVVGGLVWFLGGIVSFAHALS